MQVRYSPPGGLAARAGRPPRGAGRQLRKPPSCVLHLPTRRARRPTSPRSGEATKQATLLPTPPPPPRPRRPTAPRTGEETKKTTPLRTPPPPPAGSLREPADLPAERGGN